MAIAAVTVTHGNPDGTPWRTRQARSRNELDGLPLHRVGLARSDDGNGLVGSPTGYRIALMTPRCPSRSMNWDVVIGACGSTPSECPASLQRTHITERRANRVRTRV